MINFFAMRENEISRIVLDLAINIHKELGPGLLESVYEEVLCYELVRRYGLSISRQTAIPVVWKEKIMNIGFRADIIIENSVLIELKSIDELRPVHSKQVLTYLKLMNLKLGLLINFNEFLLVDGFKRIVNKLDD